MKRSALIQLAFVSLLGGCSIFASPEDRATYRGYVGDGTFTDRLGVSDASQVRYEVDFGEIDLSRTGIYVFNFGHLPKAQLWALGFRVAPAVDRRRASYLLEPIVRVTVTNQEQQLVMREEAPLGKWRWQRDVDVQEGVGPAFLFTTGREQQVPLESGGGFTRLEVDKKADGGWGTVFEPGPGRSYRLTVEVIKPDPIAVEFSIRAFIHGSNPVGSL